MEFQTIALPSNEESALKIVNNPEIVVDDIEKAAWIMENIKSCQDAVDIIDHRYALKKKDIDDAYQEALMILNLRKNEETRQYTNIIQLFWNRFGTQVKTVVEKQLVTVRKKSLNIAGTVIGYKKGLDKFQIQDERAAEDWALVNMPTAISTQVNKSMLEKHYKEHGELIPGTQFMKGQDNFYCKIGSVSLELPTEEIVYAPTTEENVQQG